MVTKFDNRENHDDYENYADIENQEYREAAQRDKRGWNCCAENLVIVRSLVLCKLASSESIISLAHYSLLH